MSGTVMEMIALFHIAARVVLKEAVRELKTDAPQWKERARLKADGTSDIR